MILFVVTLLESLNDRKYLNDLKTSCQMTADKLFSEEDTELNDPQKIEPKNKPAAPGILDRLFITKYPTNWFELSIGSTGVVKGSHE